MKRLAPQTGCATKNPPGCLGRRPVRLSRDGQIADIYVYEGAVANAAIKLAGVELGMFIDKKDVRLIATEYDKMGDAELAAQLAETAKLLLLSGPGEVIEYDERDK